MAITNGYCTLVELKTELTNNQGTFAAGEDSSLEGAIEAASRAIDDYTGTRFFATTETRYYTPAFHDLIVIDDLLSVTTLKTDEDDDGTYEVTWTSSDYRLEPVNAAADGLPYRRIRTKADGSYSFPISVDAGVEITGSFGFNSGASSNCPARIKRACLLLAQRIWRRKDAIFGVAGAPAVGVQVIVAEIRADQDITYLLDGVNPRVVGRVLY